MVERSELLTPYNVKKARLPVVIVEERRDAIAMALSMAGKRRPGR